MGSLGSLNGLTIRAPNGANKKAFFAEPVKSCTSVMGAIGGPCRGHLSLSQVALMEGSAVEQLNSLPSISQTWVESPG